MGTRPFTAFQVQGQQHDYRAVFTTLLQDWLGASDYALEQTQFDTFSKLALVGAPHIASPDCYVGTTSIWDDAGGQTPRPMTLSPNPASTRSEVAFQSPSAFRAKLSAFSMAGSLMHTQIVQVQAGFNYFYIDVRRWPAGTYVVRLEDLGSGKAEVGKLSVMG